MGNSGFYGLFAIFYPLVDICKYSLFVFCRVCIGIGASVCLYKLPLKYVQVIKLAIYNCVELRGTYFYSFFCEFSKSRILVIFLHSHTFLTKL